MQGSTSIESQVISVEAVASLLGVSKATIESWERNGKYSFYYTTDGRRVLRIEDLAHLSAIKGFVNSQWEEELATKPLRPYTSVELFAGAGGLAIGMEQAGFEHILLNEIDKDACATLRANRKRWNVHQGDIRTIDFTPYADQVDLLTGGFPCQAFSYAGKQAGFEDVRGTLFFELARAVNEIRPRVFMAENVKGLLSHDSGRTLHTIRGVIQELGYTLIEPRVLKAIEYQVPQKRERLILIAVRNDLADQINFSWPSPYPKIYTLRDALCGGELFPTPVPHSLGQSYPEKKRIVLEQVPQGGDWRDLPEQVQREYMGASFFLGGGKTGMARRLSWDEPSLTLTCAPAQKQTERCHPEETRPLTIREYARIQTFPDEWQFMGSLSAQYKQIGNAVPINLAAAIGRALVRLLNSLE